MSLEHPPTGTAAQAVTPGGSPAPGQCTFITFYSFKGGVGRTRALVNTAYELVHRGYDVLAIDFDLEAPDLAAYFVRWLSPAAPDTEGPETVGGIVDLVTSFKRYVLTRDPTYTMPSWKRAVKHARGYECPLPRRRGDWAIGQLDIMTAGLQDGAYAGRVATLDWGAFYSNFEGGRYIEYLREDVGRHYDFVLVDSRTGFADTAGICTIQLPDIIVPMFSTAEAKHDGLEVVIESARRQHGRAGRSRALRIVPVPARIDLSVRAEERQEWFDRVCKSRAGEWMREVAPEMSAQDMFLRIMLYYQPQYAYRSDIEGYVQDQTGQPELNVQQYRQLTDLLLRAARAPSIGEQRRAAAAEGVTAPFVLETGVSLDVSNLEREFLEKLQSIGSIGVPIEQGPHHSIFQNALKQFEPNVLRAMTWAGPTESLQDE